VSDRSCAGYWARGEVIVRIGHRPNEIPCSESDGMALAKLVEALTVGEARWTALNSGDAAVLCCCVRHEAPECREG
jgi:hypothetical protein